MNREELIDEAAMEISIAKMHGEWTDAAQAALAVFEKAHAPTDDDRAPEFEALEQDLFKHQPVLSMSDGGIAGCQCMDRVFHQRTEDWGTHLAEVFEALRRSEVPKPSAERCFWCGHPARGAAEWQGDGDRYASCGVEHHGSDFAPSDAHVLAAVDAFMASQLESEDGPSLVHKNMAAALRAAMSLREGSVR